MVAMRVVNNVEREVVRAEWENWLLDENTRCKQVQIMLRENRTNGSPGKKIKSAISDKAMEAKERERKDRLDELRRWQEEYCGSCKMEQERFLKGRKHLSFA
jgi:hypothetical protein